MSEKELTWTAKLDWLNILQILGLHSIIQISELKRDRAIKKITKTFGYDVLIELECDELDKLVADELKELMKKELTMQARKEERIEKQMRSKIIPFKRGGIIKIDPRDFKDIDPNADPEEIIKAFYKKFMGERDDDDEKDEDKNKFTEDSTGYYI
jgi:hypothetical protein